MYRRVRMPGLRLLLRFAPFLVGALAAAVWLRRRQGVRPALMAPPEPLALEPPQTRTGRFDRSPPAEADAHDEPVDIVTIVDDLLRAGR